jgi:hypothetical protein
MEKTCCRGRSLFSEAVIEWGAEVGEREERCGRARRRSCGIDGVVACWREWRRELDDNGNGIGAIV